ncbi:MAG: DMT family transporter [Gammaproteobacteria bacterium]|nr:DMT family transporter [Gammaproteobacteria bacterium]
MPVINNPYILLILAPLIWGGNTVVSKLAVGEIEPMTLVFFRWLIALLVLLPVALPHVKREWCAIRQSLHWLMMYGVVGFALFNIVFYIAAQYTSAINIALIQSFIPIFILLLNFVFYKQRLVKAQLLGLVMAFLGVVLIVTKGNVTVLKKLDLNRGDLLMLFAVLCYALYSIGLRYKPSISWLSFIFVAAFFAFITSIPFALYEVITIQKPVIKLSIKSFSLLIYVGVLASIVAQISYAKGVGLIGANRAGFAINLVPVFGVVLAVIILHESIHWFHIVGMLFVLGGITISEKTATPTSCTSQ